MTVTCLMPGATETEFFERADMLDTKVGTDEKDDPADVAQVGYDAMMRGDGDVVAGWKNKLQTAVANVTPSGDAGRAAPQDGRAGHGEDAHGRPRVGRARTGKDRARRRAR